MITRCLFLPLTAALQGRAEENEPSVGGQAVIEGVMMRARRRYSVSVRETGGGILNSSYDFIPFPERYPFFNRPVLRGFGALVDSLVIGYRSLTWSMDVFSAGQTDAKTTSPAQNRLTGYLAFAFSLALSFGLFFYLPFFLALQFRRFAAPGADPLLLHLTDGLVKLGIFLAYVWIIGRMKDVKRVFMYHGAEHKTIHAKEHGEPLTVAAIRRFPKEHSRCGTSFVFVVIVTGIIMHSLIRTDGMMLNLLFRLIMLPLISGLSYEVIRFTFRNGGALSRLLAAPGLFFQALTTAEPEDGMIEVAVASLTALESAPAGSRA